MSAIDGQHYDAPGSHPGMWFTGAVPSDGDLGFGLDHQVLLY